MYDSTGSVGIGTANPLANLHIVDPAYTGLKLSSNETPTTNKYGIISGSQYDSANEAEGYALLATWGQSGINRLSIGGGWSTHNTVTQIDFWTAADAVTRTGTQRMTINSAGNVGIGTTSPASKLQVAGGDLGLGSGTAAGNQPVTVWLTNASGAPVTAGMIVIIGGSSDDSFTVTATANSTSVLGVVYESSCVASAVCRIAVGGVADVLSAGATTRGQHVVTSATNGKAGSVAASAAGSSIGVWLQSLGSAGTGRALLR